MKQLFSLIFITVSFFTFAQVGISTTFPNAQLDIRASNQTTPSNTDGLLIPHIDTFPITNPTTAQQGMLVYLTTTVDLKIPGFYYWNFSTLDWIPFVTSKNISTFEDSDWFEESTTVAPDAITDDMYHIGNTAIGKNTANYKLDIEETGNLNAYVINATHSNASGDSAVLHTNITSLTGTTASGTHNTVIVNGGKGNGVLNDIQGTNSTEIYGIKNNITHTGSGTKYGIYNTLSYGSGKMHGVYNIISAATSPTNEQNGVFNHFSGNNSATHHGMYNKFSGTGDGNNIGIYNEIGQNGNGLYYGMYNQITGNGTTAKYGIYNTLSGNGVGSKYGVYTLISNDTGGTDYGIYSDVTKAGSFAGYFLGKVSIGTSVATNYILPANRGIANQIMQTDGLGNASWVTQAVPTIKPINTISSVTYNITTTDYTVRILESVSNVQLPSATTNTGKTYIIIGANGISAKTITTLGGTLYDDASGTNITALNAGNRYMVQSDGTNWIVIGS